MFDADVHPRTFATDPGLMEYLPERWAKLRRGIRAAAPARAVSARGTASSRAAGTPQTPEGAPPGSDPDVRGGAAAGRYDMSAGQ